MLQQVDAYFLVGMVGLFFIIQFWIQPGVISYFFVLIYSTSQQATTPRVSSKGRFIKHEYSVDKQEQQEVRYSMLHALLKSRS